MSKLLFFRIGVTNRSYLVLSFRFAGVRIGEATNPGPSISSVFAIVGASTDEEQSEEEEAQLEQSEEEEAQLESTGMATQPAPRVSKLKRPNEFLNPGPASTGMATSAADTATTALTESTASTAADVKRKSSFSSSGSDSVKRARVNSPPQL